MIEFYKNNVDQKRISAIYAEWIEFILTVDQNIGDHTQLFEIFDSQVLGKEYELIFAAYQEWINKNGKKIDIIYRFNTNWIRETRASRNLHFDEINIMINLFIK